MGPNESRPSAIIADDHERALALIRQILEPEFEIVASVQDGQALLEAVARRRPDLLVVDVYMPGLNGIEAVRRLKIELPDIPVVFISTDAGIETRQRALRASALGFVTKALAAEDLLPAARAALNGESFVSSSPE